MIRVYVSSATDQRPVERLLARYGLSFTIEQLPMGSSEQRQRFADLKQQHDWTHLPMVFVDETFIGGEPELRRHLAEQANDPVSRIGFALGLGGLIPFIAIGAALVAGIGIGKLPLMALLLGYAATILSFVGAVHWGLALTTTHVGGRGMLLGASVVPALLAWLALALQPPYGLALFITGFAGWYAWERYIAWPRFPRWYQKLRGILTAVVCVVLLIVALTT